MLKGDINVKNVERFMPKINIISPVFARSDLIQERCYYNLTRLGEETRETNIFGGYDYVKSEVSELAVPVKIKKIFWRWEVIE